MVPTSAKFKLEQAMAHEIDFTNGRANVYLAEKGAWHGLGVVTEKAQSSEEAIKLAGLDWNVQQFPMLAFDENQAPIPVETHVANTRSDTKAILGIVTRDYTPLQNREAFDFLDSLLQDGIVKYESAGSLFGGKVVWMLARMDKGMFEVGSGDVVKPYLLLSTAHDGTRAVKVKPTAVRVVCSNTLSASLADQSDSVSIRHTADVKHKLEEAKYILGFTKERFERFQRSVEQLAKTNLVTKQAKAFVEDILPPVNEDGEEWPVNVKRGKRVMDLWDNHELQQLPGSKGTAWGMVNAFTHYVDHELPIREREAKSRAEKKLNSAWFGQGAALKTKVYTKALELV